LWQEARSNLVTKLVEHPPQIAAKARARATSEELLLQRWILIYP
jgi:hypothetical protein